MRALRKLSRPLIECGLTGMQLHYQLRPEVWHSRLREHSGDPAADGSASARDALRLRFRDPAATSCDNEHAVDAVLIDSRTAKAVGGTGVAFDWRAAQDEFPAQCPASAPHRRRRAANRRTSPTRSTPCSPGVSMLPAESKLLRARKDPAKLKAFVNAAREAAAAEIEEAKQPARSASG